MFSLFLQSFAIHINEIETGSFMQPSKTIKQSSKLQNNVCLRLFFHFNHIGTWFLIQILPMTTKLKLNHWIEAISMICCNYSQTDNTNRFTIPIIVLVVICFSFTYVHLCLFLSLFLWSINDYSCINQWNHNHNWYDHHHHHHHHNILQICCWINNKHLPTTQTKINWNVKRGRKLHHFRFNWYDKRHQYHHHQHLQFQLIHYVNERLRSCWHYRWRVRTIWFYEFNFKFKPSIKFDPPSSGFAFNYISLIL